MIVASPIGCKGNAQESVLSSALLRKPFKWQTKSLGPFFGLSTQVRSQAGSCAGFLAGELEPILLQRHSEGPQAGFEGIFNSLGLILEIILIRGSRFSKEI